MDDSQHVYDVLPVEGEAAPLSFCKGISSEQIDEVVYYAHHDETVRHNTSDSKRFENKAAVQAWLAKGRSIYTLTASSGILAGIIWFGPKELPYKAYTEQVDRQKYGLTFSVRLYGEWRGKHLGYSFMTMGFSYYKHTNEYREVVNNGFWLETSADNIPGIAVYQKLGFHKITLPDEHNKILMIATNK